MAGGGGCCGVDGREEEERLTLTLG